MAVEGHGHAKTSSRLYAVRFLQKTTRTRIYKKNVIKNGSEHGAQNGVREVPLGALGFDLRCLRQYSRSGPRKVRKYADPFHC